MTALKPYVPRAVNRALDPSNEGNLSQTWISNNGTLYVASNDTTVKHSGTRSLLLTRSATSPSSQFAGATLAPGVVTSAGRVLVTPGETLSFAFYMRTSVAAATGRVNIRWWDATGTALGGQIAGPLFTFAAVNTWQRFAFDGQTAPAAAAYVQVIGTLTMGAGNSIGGELGWFDSLMINGAAVSEPYFDGATPGCSWAGVAYQSQSIRAVVTPWTQYDGTKENPLDVAGLWDGAALQPVDLRDVATV